MQFDKENFIIMLIWEAYRECFLVTSNKCLLNYALFTLFNKQFIKLFGYIVWMLVVCWEFEINWVHFASEFPALWLLNQNSVNAIFGFLFKVFLILIWETSTFSVRQVTTRVALLLPKILNPSNDFHRWEFKKINLIRKLNCLEQAKRNASEEFRQICHSEDSVQVIFYQSFYLAALLIPLDNFVMWLLGWGVLALIFGLNWGASRTQTHSISFISQFVH